MSYTPTNTLLSITTSRYDNKQDIFVEEYMYITIERNQIQHITEHILHFRIFLAI